MTPCPKIIPTVQRRYGNWLLLIMTLFAIRVAAQPVAAHWPMASLPSFDDWHSATLPYPVLLGSQFVILIVGVAVIQRFYSHRLAPRPVLGMWLLSFGGIYWVVMVSRLLLGFTLLSNLHWFAQTLPALFHLLLANFVMLTGEYLRKPLGSSLSA